MVCRFPSPWTLAGLCLVVLRFPSADMATAAEAAQLATPKVDFSYAFATPHRITVGRPDSSDRTLLDLQAGSLRMAWTYEDLTRYPLAAFVTPATAWDIRITPQVDGKPLASSRWTRLDGFLPALDNTYEDPRGVCRLQVLGAKSAALIRIEVVNPDQQPHQFVLRCETSGWGENRGWVEPGHWGPNVLLTGGHRRRAHALRPRLLPIAV